MDSPPAWCRHPCEKPSEKNDNTNGKEGSRLKNEQLNSRLHIIISTVLYTSPHPEIHPSIHLIPLIVTLVYDGLLSQKCQSHRISRPFKPNCQMRMSPLNWVRTRVIGQEIVPRVLPTNPPHWLSLYFSLYLHLSLSLVRTWVRPGACSESQLLVWQRLPPLCQAIRPTPNLLKSSQLFDLFLMSPMVTHAS